MSNWQHQMILKSKNIEKNFMDLGVDSSKLVEVAQQIEREQGIELYPTLFFEYQSIRELAQYFAQEHADTFSRNLTALDSGKRAEEERGPGAAQAVPELTHTPAAAEASGGSTKEIETPDATARARIERRPPNNLPREDIAIIGMAGRVAESRDLNTFWEHLEAGRNLIKEIPLDRWDYRPWFDENPDVPNKTYSKWGSFLDDVDKFDPLFFKQSLL